MKESVRQEERSNPSSSESVGALPRGSLGFWSSQGSRDLRKGIVPLTPRDSLLSLILTLPLTASGCGGSTAVSSPGPTTVRVPGPCGAYGAVGRRGGVALISAALFSATVIVGTETSTAPACHDLRSGEQAHLPIGDTVQFVDNDVPRLEPPSADIVRISVLPGPGELGPGAPGGDATPHIIVTITAAHAGIVTVHWINCAGTGC